jgi:PAS domain S-box-containing protein
MLMRCRLPTLDNPSEFTGRYERLHPTKIDEIVPYSSKYVSNRASDPWNSLTASLQHLCKLPNASVEERIALDVEETYHDLHQARDNFAAIFHASPSILCIIQLNGLRYCEVNKVYEQRTGYSRDEVVGKPIIKFGLWNNVKDRDRVFRKLLVKGSLRGHREDFHTKTGEPLNALLSAEIMEFGGERCALLAAEDITMRRQAEKARADLAQRLINAQEQQFTHIARELHDNIGQSLALFSMEVETTRLCLTGRSPEIDARLTLLGGRLKDLGRVVGNLSHQLHSSELDLLGLVVAIKGLCREFSEQYHVQVSCACGHIPDNLCSNIALCLFRVTQEALHNVAKHSQAHRINIELHGVLNSLVLHISDDGVGFAPNNAHVSPGLGMTSMRERLHLIGGEFKIISKPGTGTRIEATVPLRQ